jgi:hypothetical protein
MVIALANEGGTSMNQALETAIETDDSASSARILPLVANAVCGIAEQHGIDLQLRDVIPALVVEAFAALLDLLPAEMQEALAQEVSMVDLEQRILVMAAAVESVPELYAQIIAIVAESLGACLSLDSAHMEYGQNAKADIDDFLRMLGKQLA